MTKVAGEKLLNDKPVHISARASSQNCQVKRSTTRCHEKYVGNRLGKQASMFQQAAFHWTDVSPPLL
jgi:hypothetical protein